MAECAKLPCFVWRIRNFISVQKKLSCALYSFGLIWQLRFTRFMGDDDIEMIRLSLECLSASEEALTLEFRATVYFVFYDGSRDLLRDIKRSLDKNEWYLWTDKAEKFQESYKEYLDIATFSITVTPVGDFKSLRKYEIEVEEAYPKSPCVNSLTEDMEKLFNNEESSDFTLKCGEKEFHVHKTVIAARSDFFADIIRSDRKESNENMGKIEDVEPEILEFVLRYLYTREIPELPKESLQKMYTAADMFGVNSLTTKCYSLLLNNLQTFPEELDKIIEKFNSRVFIDEKEESLVSKKNKLLQDLYMSREWRTFSLQFPDEAQEICSRIPSQFLTD